MICFRFPAIGADPAFIHILENFLSLEHFLFRFNHLLTYRIAISYVKESHGMVFAEQDYNIVI